MHYCSLEKDSCLVKVLWIPFDCFWHLNNSSTQLSCMHIPKCMQGYYNSVSEAVKSNGSGFFEYIQYWSKYDLLVQLEWKKIRFYSLYSDWADWHRAARNTICICPVYLVIFHISCIRQRRSVKNSQSFMYTGLICLIFSYEFCLFFLFYLDRLNHLDQHATALWHSNIWHCCSFFSDSWTVLRSVASYCINSEFLLSYGNVL